MASSIFLRALDALDSAILVLSEDLSRVLLCNQAAVPLVDKDRLLPDIDRAARAYAAARGSSPRPPPALRLEHAGEVFYLRAVPSPPPPPLEIVVVRRAVLRDPDLLRALAARYGVSAREFEVVQALRLGKTNRQIATELGLAEATVARHVHRLLERLGCPNRTRLVHLVERLAARD